MIIRLLVIVLLAAACLTLSVYFHAVHHTDVVCTHLMYIPIVLAGMWWGRRSVVLAAVFGLAILSLHRMGIASGAVTADAARAVCFVVVAFCVGMLSEKLKAGETALRISEQKHKLMSEKSLVGIFVYRDGKYLFVNPRYAEMVGYRPDELIGAPIWDTLHEDDRARIQYLVKRRAADGSTDLQYEVRIVTKKGDVRWADVASAVGEYDGEPAVIVNVYDITDRKEAERKRGELADLARKQEEQLVHSTRLAELGEMAAAVAHELNQPLTGIRNFARNAFYMIEKNVGEPDEIKDNLRMISEQVDRASKIINQMRELTRRSERQFVAVDLNGIIRESVEFLSPQLKLSCVETTLDLGDIPEIMGDRIRLEQVLLNLITNARQAMETTGERRLTVRTYLEEGGHCPVVVEVIDTGKGFSASEAQKLFTPFFSTKKVGHGTGLGLSISLSIIKDHNGTIAAKGEPGKGATFTVRLPVEHQDGPAEVSSRNE
ncbi:MAG: ATP-binding protein [Planctomycetota bacterium]